MKGFIVLMALCVGSVYGMEDLERVKRDKMRQYFSEQMEFCLCIAEDRTCTREGSIYMMGSFEAFNSAKNQFERIYGPQAD